MPRKVLIIPGFLDSTLGRVDDGTILWFNTGAIGIVGMGPLALSPDGVTPLPPDGTQMGVDNAPDGQWPFVMSSLRFQLPPDRWTLRWSGYDFRLDINDAADQVVTTVRREASVVEPMTLVGHSMGGLVMHLAWRKLVATGDELLVRRIISIATPFFGSYLPLSAVAGAAVSIQQLIALGSTGGFTVAKPVIDWTLKFVNSIITTWPALYQLYPSLFGPDAAQDPNRALLYTAANYVPIAQVKQPWLDYAKNTFQPIWNVPSQYPPPWVATYVYGSGLATPFRLLKPGIPLDTLALGNTQDGDGIVTHNSAVPAPGQVVRVTGAHTSLPLGITYSGTLAALIKDERGPPDPPPPEMDVKQPITVQVSEPPESDYITGIQCIGGG